MLGVGIKWVEYKKVDLWKLHLCNTCVQRSVRYAVNILKGEEEGREFLATFSFGQHLKR